MNRRVPCLVVGAGAQGLSFALELARRGEPVLLVERSPVIGGQARSFRYGGYTFDLGLHAFVSRDRALVRLAREVLGKDFSSFHPRAASRLGNGSMVEDTSSWRVLDVRRKLYSLVEDGDNAWNCMRIAQPQNVIYPKRGGFGALLDKMAALFRKRGGRIMLGTSVGPADFGFEGGRLVSARVGGKTLAVSGCFWSAGTYLLNPDAPRHPTAGQALVLFHFLAKGEAPVPYHWVRLHEIKNPFLPRLVYYPKRFSGANAPRGRYGVGAVVPLPPLRLVPKSKRAIYEWFSQDPAAFSGAVVDCLDRAGLMRKGDVLKTVIERTSLPPERTERAAPHPYEGVPILGDADRWLLEDARESGVPLQMASALKAAAELSARA
jgi:glycine/D-amino acid oxidase-like deaminating enzyme